jgi:hypothetical protein
MDPMSTLIVSSAIGGAAGGFVKELSGNGIKWLVELVTAQSPEMQAIAKQNMENFVTRLAARVERLEKDIPAEQAAIFHDAMKHPASALLIKSAMVDAAITDNEDKHEMLTELIAQRLTAKADDMIALAGAAACQIVNSLSSRQIKLLAVLATVKSIRPQNKISVENKDAAKQVLTDWWKKSTDIFLSDKSFQEATNLDYEHLAALGCIRISIGSTDLNNSVQQGIYTQTHNFTAEELKTESWYSAFEKQWSNLGHATPTSIGQLIGILHRDAKLKTKTVINW